MRLLASLFKELEESTCQDEAPQGSLVWRERYSYSKVGSKNTKPENTIILFTFYTKKLRHILFFNYSKLNLCSYLRRMVTLGKMILYQAPSLEKDISSVSLCFDLLSTMINKLAYSARFKDPPEEIWKHDMNIEN